MEMPATTTRRAPAPPTSAGSARYKKTVQHARTKVAAAVASFLLTLERIFESTGILLNSKSLDSFRMLKAVLHNFLMMSASGMLRQAQQGDGAAAWSEYEEMVGTAEDNDSDGELMRLSSI
jgi:hypothetical protein